MNPRGRPKLTMTKRRAQVLARYCEMVSNGDDVRLAEIARRCGLYDYRDARRIVTDLRRMLAI